MFGLGKKKAPAVSEAASFATLSKQVADLSAQVAKLTELVASGKLEVRKVRRIKMKVKKVAKKAAEAAAPAQDRHEAYRDAGVAIDKHNEVLERMKQFVKDNPGNRSGRGEAYHLENGQRKTIHLSNIEDIKAVIKRAEAGEIQLTDK